jgi:hypothetical protein
VGRWVSSGDTEFGSPVNSYSWGVWSINGPLKNIGTYRMHDMHGNLLAYRLDILKDVTIQASSSLSSHSTPHSTSSCHPIEDRIEFSDLVVDCWLWPEEEDGRIRIRPQDTTVDDLEELHSTREQGQGLLSAGDVALINDTLFDILEDPREVVAAVDVAIAEAKHQAAAGGLGPIASSI